MTSGDKKGKGKGSGLARGLTNYGDPAFSLYLRRSFAKSMGYSSEMLTRPVVGIADSRSGFNNCHRHFPELIEAVKRGVLAAGGLPVEFPTVSLGEVFLHPTSMMFRNLMSIDVEEMIRAQPMDAVVLVGGCDKTVPAQLMGAASADIPAVQLIAGPMMPTSYRGERLGACTDCRRFWAMHRAGKVDSAEDRDHRRQPRHHSRHLRGDGHRIDHGVDRRGARHGASRHRRHSGGARRPAARRRGKRAPRGADGRVPRASERDHHREIGRERAARAARDRRLDECNRAPDRDCGTSRHPHFAQKTE